MKLEYNMNSNKTALVTGATGYIGAHVTKALYDAGFEVHAWDIDIWNRNNISDYCHDLKCMDVTNTIPDLKYDVVIHLAGLIQVGESMSRPTDYYYTNLFGTMNVLNSIECDHFIFASTAGCFDPISPYAKSKLAAEDVIRELAPNYTIFRFFNVAGNNGLFRQFGPATHLIRVAAEAASGKRDKMVVYGNDYPTSDGTCIRDYVHVMDLANAIVNAAKDPSPKNHIYECIGSNKTFTNLQVLDIMKEVSGIDFNVEIGERRFGDPAELRVDTTSEYLNIEYNLADMCRSAYEMELK